MNEMVERVAKAICDSAEADDFDALGQNSIVRALYVQQARHAIEEMREPTEAMVDAGREAQDIHPADDFVAWNAMIDAALV